MGASSTVRRSALTFEDIVDQAIAMLQRRGRMAYRTLKRLCAGENGDVLVWTGGPSSLGASDAESTPGPLSYTPAYLAEKILLSKTALEGERTQATVMFADPKGLREPVADCDPEEAR